MNKPFLIARKITAVLLLFTLVLTLNITAFADSPDTSPNVPRREDGATQSNPNNSTVAVPADVKPVKTYTVALGKTYKLPTDVKQVGDQYSTSNSSILKVDGKAGSFTTLANGTAYIVVANNGNTRYIKVTVGSSVTTSTEGKNTYALSGHMVTITDWSTLSTTASSKEYPIQTYRFYSANGTELGSISGESMNKIITQYNVQGKASNFFVKEFNAFRGLGATAGTTNNTTTSGSTETATQTSGASLGTLINDQRTKDGIPELTYDSDMQSLADTRAKEISQTFSHVRPDGTRVSQEYYYAEINHSGSTTASGAFQSYYDSMPHRNIMLSEKYSGYAVGRYTVPNGTTYWVVLFSK